MIKLHTNHGTITLELDEKRAPATVANFLEYAKSGHFANTLFHRVIDGFMIQGGGYDGAFKQKTTRPPITNEARGGVEAGESQLAKRAGLLRGRVQGRRFGRIS